MSDCTFHHVMQYALRVPMCTEEQLQFEIDCVERKVQSIQTRTTDAYVTSER
jgi:hypothetical protein